MRLYNTHARARNNQVSGLSVTSRDDAARCLERWSELNSTLCLPCPASLSLSLTCGSHRFLNQIDAW